MLFPLSTPIETELLSYYIIIMFRLSLLLLLVMLSHKKHQHPKLKKRYKCVVILVLYMYHGCCILLKLKNPNNLRIRIMYVSILLLLRMKLTTLILDFRLVKALRFYHVCVKVGTVEKKYISSRNIFHQLFYMLKVFMITAEICGNWKYKNHWFVFSKASNKFSKLRIRWYQDYFWRGEFL